jgi:hypothetical protein
MLPPQAADGFAKRASPFLRAKIAAGGAALAAIGKKCCSESSILTETERGNISR